MDNPLTQEGGAWRRKRFDEEMATLFVMKMREDKMTLDKDMVRHLYTLLPSQCSVMLSFTAAGWWEVESLL